VNRAAVFLQLFEGSSKMKKALLIAAFMMFVAGAAYAAFPYVGLYAGMYDMESGEEGLGGSDHSACSVTVPAIFTDIEMWIWWLPDPVKGLATVEFKMTYPVTTFIGQSTVTSNPALATELGTLGGGIASTFGGLNCQYEWIWTHHQTLTVKRIPPMTNSSGVVTIVADPGLPQPPYTVIVSSCEPLFPIYECTVLNDLGVNKACDIFAVGVQSKSWGAIKSLYNE
jgi:hypothetical protein